MSGERRTKRPSKWDVAPIAGQHDHLLAAIREEVARAAPQPTPAPSEAPVEPWQQYWADSVCREYPPIRNEAELAAATDEFAVTLGELGRRMAPGIIPPALLPEPKSWLVPVALVIGAQVVVAGLVLLLRSAV